MRKQKGILSHEFGIYPSWFSCWANRILFPLKIIIPQPIIKKIPVLLTNEDIRIMQVLRHSKGRLLDIGCGNNRLVNLYRNSGGEGVGVDVYPWDDSHVLVDDSSDLPFTDLSFNTVTFVASINHIPNRLAVLREIRRLLADDGHVILTNLNPFISEIWHKWAFWDKDTKVRGMKEGEVWGFSDNDLTRLLNQAGFRVVARKRFSWRINQIFICDKM